MSRQEKKNGLNNEVTVRRGYTILRAFAHFGMDGFWPSSNLASMDLFGDTAAILNSLVSNSYYGMLRGPILTSLQPGHLIIAI